MQVRISYSVHIAPTDANERSQAHEARACPSYDGTPVFNDVMVKAGKNPDGTDEFWCGKLLIVFRMRLDDTDPVAQDEDGCQYDNHMCALVRWYELVEGLEHAN